MALFETFHERQAKLRSAGVDVYIYDFVPQPLRVQILQLMEDVLGGADDCYSTSEYQSTVLGAYGEIVKLLHRANGVLRLSPRHEYDNSDAHGELFNYMLSEANAERFMSAVELVCRVIETRGSEPRHRGLPNARALAIEVIADINGRMKQHGIGYEYDTEILRVDSEFVHSEAVKPALALLRDVHYQTAQDEFLKAYEHFRRGDNQDALTNALKAFESTMKIIATKRGWQFDPKDTANRLIEVCYENGLIPDFWRNHFGGLRSTLESAIPTARNRAGGHGGGASPIEVPEHLAAYVLHMTASTIVFLVRAEQSLGPL